MTTRYRITTDVHAWKIGEDGSLPPDSIAIDLIPHHIDGKVWLWLDRRISGDFQFAYPGDWIVQSAYGLEAMTDEAFRERCVEVPE